MKALKLLKIYYKLIMFWCQFKRDFKDGCEQNWRNQKDKRD